MDIALPSLTTREAIADALHRAILGFDTADQTLLDSALTPDAVMDLDGRIMTGLDEIHSECFEHIAKMETTHFITNVRISVPDGASTAKITAHALSQHYRPGDGKIPDSAHLTGGSLYDIHAVKDERDGLWKMSIWKIKPIWFSGDWNVMKQV